MRSSSRLARSSDTSGPRSARIFIGAMPLLRPEVSLPLGACVISRRTVLPPDAGDRLNALAYHTDDPESPSEHLRPHCPKNDKQHRATLEQLKPDEFRKLRLPTIRDRFGAAAERGETENLSHLDYLSELTTLECETRRPSVLRRSTFLSLRGDSRETQPRLRKR